MRLLSPSHPFTLCQCTLRPMHLCRFKTAGDRIRIGLVENGSVRDLTAAGVEAMYPILEEDDPVRRLRPLATGKLPATPLASVDLLSPIERQEVWAAGVTYLRSKVARMEESNFSATAYDK